MREASGLDGIIPQNITEKFHPYLVSPTSAMAEDFRRET
jgi:hypothetical protein